MPSLATPFRQESSLLVAKPVGTLSLTRSGFWNGSKRSECRLPRSSSARSAHTPQTAIRTPEPGPSADERARRRPRDADVGGDQVSPAPRKAKSSSKSREWIAKDAVIDPTFLD
jgi:hypothetical protein